MAAKFSSSAMTCKAVENGVSLVDQSVTNAIKQQSKRKALGIRIICINVVFYSLIKHKHLRMHISCGLIWFQVIICENLQTL